MRQTREIRTIGPWHEMRIGPVDMQHGRLLAFALVISPATVSAIAACTSDEPSTAASTTSDAGACSPASLRRYDEARHCLKAPQPVDEVCLRSIFETPSASLGFVCAFAPDGGVWGTTVPGQIDLLAEGWHFTDHRVGAYPIPASMQATADETIRCGTIECAPDCPEVTERLIDMCPSRDAD